MKANTYQKKFNQGPEALGRVAVLFGGTSAEREISLQSGKAVLEGLLESGVNAFGVDLGEGAVSQLQNLECDRVFIALHGPGGEDGKVQALLTMMGLPFTGSDFASSSIAMHKVKTKRLWAGSELPSPEFELLTEKSDFGAIIEKLTGSCFVKPAHEGSSIGMRCVDSAGQLQEAFAFAAQYDSEVFAERSISGREFTVSILNGYALPAIELKTNNAFYDYDAKYLSNDTEYFCPCKISDSEEGLLASIALSAFDALGCSGWGRIDFMQDQAGRFYLLEANTVPGMTSHSLVPMAAKAAGLSFNELLLEILWSTLEVGTC
ncbi:MAG: D-alanine--D-alanine ligase [Agarilytica sp.]